MTYDVYGIGNALVDYVAEPQRKLLIPYFEEVKEAVINAGALGVGISGSGPSIFALSEGTSTAKKVAEAMDSVYKSSDIAYAIYVSNISKTGARSI